jgi:hypothetical protein
MLTRWIEIQAPTGNLYWVKQYYEDGKWNTRKKHPFQWRRAFPILESMGIPEYPKDYLSCRNAWFLTTRAFHDVAPSTEFTSSLVRLLRDNNGIIQLWYYWTLDIINAAINMIPIPFITENADFRAWLDSVISWVASNFFDFMFAKG